MTNANCVSMFKTNQQIEKSVWKGFFFTVYGTQTQQTQQNSITNTQILVDHCFTKALQTIKVEK